MTELPWLTILGIIPLLGAAAVASVPTGRDLLAKQIALATSLVVLAGAIVMCAAFVPGGDRFQFVQAYDWIPAFNVQYAVGVDGIALVLIALIAVLVPVVLLASWHDADPAVAEAVVGARSRACRFRGEPRPGSPPPVGAPRCWPPPRRQRRPRRRQPPAPPAPALSRRCSRCCWCSRR